MEPEVPEERSEAFRLRELERGRRSLFYFGTAILGFTVEDDDGHPYLPPLHRDLAAFLEGRSPHYPWSEAVVCAARDSGKSVWVRAYVLWRVFYIVNFSVLFLSSTHRRAQELFFPIISLLTTGDRAEYIQWLFSHRIPDKMEGSNWERLRLIQTDPLRNAAITIGGRESALESVHPDLIVGDDIEGFEAEKSITSNREAADVWERIRPLRRVPTRSQILLLGTPWGEEPLVYTLRDSCGWKSEEDNATSPIKFWWRPIRDKNGKSIWPERFPEWWIDQELRLPYARKQLLLERGGAGDTFFNMDAVESSYYSYANVMRSLIRYQSFDFNPDELTAEGMVVPKPVERVLHLSKLRFYVHFDPKHRPKKELRFHRDRPVDAAITVVGVAPDFHVFLLEYWCDEQADLPEQLQKLMSFYRKYEPESVTYEGVGAQVWLVKYVQLMESSNPNWRSPISVGLFGGSTALPRLSRRLVEDTDKQSAAKQDIWRSALGPWVNSGVIHFRPDQEEMLRQLSNALDDNVAVDLIDCLAQGPKVWKPAPFGDLTERFSQARRYVESLLGRRKGSKSHSATDRTGWQDPGWRS